MGKPRIVIADRDEQYAAALLHQFMNVYSERIDLELITDKDFFKAMIAVPQKMDILLVSEDLFDTELTRHSIRYIFVLTEEETADMPDGRDVSLVFKYSNLKDIFSEIVRAAAEVLCAPTETNQHTKTILMYSACGGTGKTTIALALAACLSRYHKRVLYMDAEYIQTFQLYLGVQNTIPGSAASKLQAENADLYTVLSNYICHDEFDYLLPFQGAINAYNIAFSIFGEFVSQLQQINLYDYIIIDTESSFSNDKARLLDQADKVLIVTQANRHSIFGTNLMLKNITHSDSDKFMILCNAIPEINSVYACTCINAAAFTIHESIEWMQDCEQMNPHELAKNKTIQKIAYAML